MFLCIHVRRYSWLILLLLNASLFSQNSHEVENFQTEDSLFYQHKRNLEEAKKNGGHLLIAHEYLKMGSFYFESGIYNLAIQQYADGLAFCNRDKDTIFSILSNKIGEVYLSRNNFEIAKRYLVSAIEASEKLRYEAGLAKGTALLGFCLEKTGEYKDALVLQKQSLAIFTKINDPNGRALAYENIGSIYEDLENYPKALEYFEKAHNIVKGKRNTEEAVVLNNIGDVFRKMGNYKIALYYTNNALNVAQELRDLHQLKSAYKDLSKTYVLLNDFEKAYSFLEQHILYNEIWLTQQNSQQINVLNAIYDTDKKGAQIALLQEQNNTASVAFPKNRTVYNSNLLTLNSNCHNENQQV
ncbi:tetratricopeptide repeat protein [Arenibacter sp. GZD96]|uniref:tetratricopeptide repeat protein n=1 Tax=Aurantibrevibacter litoralis TaxID=3106030 RepID=UPI002AFF59C3|nr:tetratricopeptide repeat protein [Arenibacter sp. GZD-96]MEA1787216.1 tetratricopeptide repeat protein [Arenibacter sp. GZD-96]